MKIDAIQPDPTLFPEFDGALRRAFHEEMNRFVGSVFNSDAAASACRDQILLRVPGATFVPPTSDGLGGAVELLGLASDHPLAARVRVAERS